MSVSTERTHQFLSLLASKYKLVDYSYTPAGTQKKTIIAPSNPNRVLFYCRFAGNAENEPKIALSGNRWIDIPIDIANNQYLITVQHHYMLPTLEIFHNDMVFGIEVKAFGIVLE